MKIICISYTKNGALICGKLIDFYGGTDHTASGYTMTKYASEPLMPIEAEGEAFYERAFAGNDAMIFIGAAGIALRKTAPYIKSKAADPAVIVIDEQGKFVIPILSGHIGGANRLAYELASHLNAMTVITTATDIQNKFAIDTWAAENGLNIANIEAIKIVSSAILDGIPVYIHSDFSIESCLPDGLSSGEFGEIGVCISKNERLKPFNKTLNLIPKTVIAGMGCRKAASSETAENLLLEALSSQGLSPKSLCAIATIDIKKDEPALVCLAEKYKVPLITCTSEQLQNVPGEFTSSEFVKSTVGVDNVCERASLAAGGDRLILKKKSNSGVTVALAEKNITLIFS